VVFLIDASISVGEKAIAAEIAAARSILAHTPDADFELVIFRRRAERVAGALVPASVADRVFAAAASRLAPGNGSSVEAGLALAGDALAGAKGPTRVVILSDERMRQAFRTTDARAALAKAPAGTIVVAAQAEPVATESSWSRFDDGALAELAEGTGGVSDSVLVGAKGLDDATLALVRPVSIDDLKLVAPEIGDLDASFPISIDEGSGVRMMAVTEQDTEADTVTGKIWARAVTLRLPPDLSFSARLPALVFGDEVADELEPQVATNAARAGRVVSPSTAYIAVEDGAAPSKNGLGPKAITTSGADPGSGMGYGHGTIGVGTASHAPSDWLAQRLAGKCPTPAKLAIESSLAEVVDVTVTEGADVACWTEAAWALALDPAVFWHVRDLFEITVSGGR
jgi:hypothetical protein